MLEPGLSPKPVLHPTQIQAHRNSSDLWKILARYFSNPCANEDNNYKPPESKILKDSNTVKDNCRPYQHTLMVCCMELLSLFISS